MSDRAIPSADLARSEREAAAARSVPDTSSLRTPLGPTGMLGLQRMAGNSAATRLLARQRHHGVQAGGVREDAAERAVWMTMLRRAQGLLRQRYGRWLGENAVLSEAWLSHVHYAPRPDVLAAIAQNANTMTGLSSPERARGVGRSRLAAEEIAGVTLWGAGTVDSYVVGEHLDHVHPDDETTRALTVRFCHELLHAAGHGFSELRLDEAFAQYLALAAVDGAVTGSSADGGDWDGPAGDLARIVEAVPGLDVDTIASVFFSGHNRARVGDPPDYALATAARWNPVRSYIDHEYGAGATELLFEALQDGQHDVVRWLLHRQVLAVVNASGTGVTPQPAQLGGLENEESKRPLQMVLRLHERIADRVAHPERFSWGEWIEAFAYLPRYSPSDQLPPGSRAERDAHRRGHPELPAVSRSSFPVIGEPAPHVRSTGAPGNTAAAPGRYAAPRIDEQPGDVLLDHPSLSWLRAHLPENLIETIYELPTDCADVAIILRHVWLTAHHQHETVRINGRDLVIGGTMAGVAEQDYLLHHVIEPVSSANAAALIHTPYMRAPGQPELRLRELLPVLRPGDILVWRHGDGNGHVQTVTHVHRTAGGVIDGVDTIAGNQPLPPDAGQRYRYTPGRRMEAQPLQGNRLAADLQGNWIWSDGTGTRLVRAGSPEAPGAH